MAASKPNQLSRVRNLRIQPRRPADVTRSCSSRWPETDEQVDVILRGRADVKAILDGADDRLLVIVGPCSVHDVDAALDYASRLRAQGGADWTATCASRCASTSRSRARRSAGRG